MEIFHEKGEIFFNKKYSFKIFIFEHVPVWIRTWIETESGLYDSQQ